MSDIMPLTSFSTKKLKLKTSCNYNILLNNKYLPYIYKNTSMDYSGETEAVTLL
jgi:hypothetical protein